MIERGIILKEIETDQIFEIVSLQGYMNYSVGIEDVNRDNADTEYIKESEIGVKYTIL